MSKVRGPLNSADIPEAQPVGGVFNSVSPAPLDGQGCALQLDSEGNLLVNVAVGGGGGGGTVKIEDTSGNALNSNGTGALNVAVVSGGGSNASVGTTGAPAPTSATEIGIVDGSGNLQNVSPTTPMPVSATSAANASGNPIFVESVTGSTTAVTGIVEVAPTGAANTKTNPFFNEITDGTNVMGAMANFGTSPTAVTALNVNSSLFIGTTVASAAAAGVQKVGITGGTGTVLDAVLGAAKPANVLQVGGNDGTNAYAIPLAAGGTSVLVSGTVSIGSGPFTVVGNLTNNNAAPSTNNLGVLPAIAETAYTTVTYTTGDMVLPVTDLHGALNQDLQAVAGVQLGATAVTAFGTAPAAANVPGVNASLYAGTTGITATSTSLNVNVTNTTQAVVGNLTNNNAAPTTTNLGVLPALANAAVPSWTEGDQVLMSVDLSGHQRVVATGAAASGSAVAGNPVLIAGTSLAGNAVTLSTDVGRPFIEQWGTNAAQADAISNTSWTPVFGTGSLNGAPGFTPTFPFLFNGTTWDRLRSALVGNNVNATGLLAAGAYVQYNTTLPAPSAQNYTVAQCDTVGSTYVNIEGRKATYSAFASFTAVAGDIAVLPGSASKTIRVIRVEVSFVTSGTAAIEAVQLIKRSAADTGGTSAAMTAVPHDSTFAGASAAPLSYTVAPTPGAAVGTIRGVQFNDASSTVPGANTWIWDFGARPSSAIVLRGVAQMLTINLPTAIATQTASVSWEWTEE